MNVKHCFMVSDLVSCILFLNYLYVNLGTVCKNGIVLCLKEYVFICWPEMNKFAVVRFDQFVALLHDKIDTISKHDKLHLGILLIEMFIIIYSQLFKDGGGDDVVFLGGKLKNPTKK